jgi:hypothetical protein
MDKNDISDAGRQTPFHIASDMEDDLASLVDYGRVIARLADTFDGDEADMVARLGWQVINHAKAVERQRGMLFHALHPDRAELGCRGQSATAIR